MSKFNFRLQSVLDYRRRLVDRQRLELAGAQVRIIERQQRIVQLRQAERRALDQLDQEQRGVLDLAEVRRLTDQLAVQARHLADQQAALEQELAEAELVRLRLLDLTRDLKALESLRERQAEEFALNVRRLEQIDTNEIAARGHRLRVWP